MSHTLENNPDARAEFERQMDKSFRSGYRQALERVTGNLPTWAERRTSGKPASFNVAEAVERHRAGGVTLRQLAKEYGVTPQTIGHHVHKGQA